MRPFATSDIVYNESMRLNAVCPAVFLSAAVYLDFELISALFTVSLGHFLVHSVPVTLQPIWKASRAVRAINMQITLTQKQTR